MISDDSVPFTRSVISARDLAYDDLGLPLAGLLCWDEAQDGPRPGVLLIHGGAGLDAHAREQARRYAALGYAVLACDMFGPGVAGNRERVMACLLALRDDPALLLRRARADLTALAACPEAAGRLAAVGFCFGGTGNWSCTARAEHGFTHRDAVPGAMPGVAYDRLADERSFAAVRTFLAEALAA